MISSTKNIVFELFFELPNALGLRIFRNKKKLEKSQKWVEAGPSIQSPFQK